MAVSLDVLIDIGRCFECQALSGQLCKAPCFIKAKTIDESATLHQDW